MGCGGDTRGLCVGSFHEQAQVRSIGPAVGVEGELCSVCGVVMLREFIPEFPPRLFNKRIAQSR